MHFVLLRPFFLALRFTSPPPTPTSREPSAPRSPTGGEIEAGRGAEAAT